MTMRSAEISGLLTRWLERYTPPAQIRDNQRAQQDEAEALLAVLLRFAPQADYGAFVARALDQLEYQMKTRAWPTKGELGAVCSNMRKDAPRPDDLTGPDMAPEAITARRMERGETVGEGWLYGRSAVELIATGAVTRETMERYRSAAYLSRKALYGEAAAAAWEAEAKARHDEARADRKARMIAGAAA
jgi:hypothetical protein